MNRANPPSSTYAVCPHCKGRIPVSFDGAKRAVVEITCPYCGAMLQIKPAERKCCA